MEDGFPCHVGTCPLVDVSEWSIYLTNVEICPRGGLRRKGSHVRSKDVDGNKENNGHWNMETTLRTCGKESTHRAGHASDMHGWHQAGRPAGWITEGQNSLNQCHGHRRASISSKPRSMMSAIGRWSVCWPAMPLILEEIEWGLVGQFYSTSLFVIGSMNTR